MNSGLGHRFLGEVHVGRWRGGLVQQVIVLFGYQKL